jgi:hypothetical protein
MATPHLFRFKLELASAPPLKKSDCILLLTIARSFLALTEQNRLETCRNVLKISCADTLTIGQTWWLLTVRIGRRFGYVASIGLLIRNRFHLSLLLYLSPLTNHPSTR